MGKAKSEGLKNVGRAVQIFDLMDKGLTTSQVAAEMNMSTSLVNYYRRTYRDRIQDNIVVRLRKLKEEKKNSGQNREVEILDEAIKTILNA